MTTIHVTTERTKRAVEEATLAYWAEIVKHFPEVKTGDFAPTDSLAQRRANTQAVNSWLMWNHPVGWKREFKSR
jgi:hypothetical protein